MYMTRKSLLSLFVFFDFYIVDCLIRMDICPYLDVHVLMPFDECIQRKSPCILIDALVRYKVIDVIGVRPKHGDIYIGMVFLHPCVEIVFGI